MPTAEASDLDKVSKLRDRWFSTERGFLVDFNITLDAIGFTDRYINKMIEDAEAGKLPQKSKVVKDNTWGMIEVDWSSVRLLDCPILQRLRAIKQLGFSYLTYPSAEHSRFIHSLGMYAVVSRFLDAMSRQPQEGEEQDGIRLYPVKEALRTDLQHAAILHDAGHLPFSHVTEAALAGDQRNFLCGPESLEDFMFSAAEILRKKIHFSEALSLALILSPRFGVFYRRFVRPSQDPDAVLRIAALVAGLKPENNLRGAANLISNSSIDSDKVDYINRDALACGIPVGLDVARLFLRSSFYEVDREHLARLKVPHPIGSEVVFVVNASGVDTIDELAQARAALYQRVYLHQTTRNAERLLSKSLETLSSDDQLRNALRLLSLDDASLLTILTQHASRVVSGFAERLRTRQLPKRACVFGRSFASTWMPLAEMLPGLHQADLSKHTLGMVVARLRSDEIKREELRELESAITVEAAALAAAIRSGHSDLIPDSPTPSIVTVLPMMELPGLSKEAVVLENRELIHSSQRSISDEQNEAADIYKALGYVLTDYEWKEVVCLATRKVLATRVTEPCRPMDVGRTVQGRLSSQRMNVAGRLVLDLNTVVRRTGLSATRIAQIQQRASEVGFFDEAPWLVHNDPTSIAPLAEILRKFEGEGGWSVTPKTCAAFVQQFPPSLRAEITSILVKNFRLLDREMIRSDLTRLITELAQGTTAVVCGLTPDSGNMVRTLLEHESKASLAAQNVLIEKTIDVALDRAGSNDLIILCDDNISSGSQAQCQLRAWCGLAREEWPEAHRLEQNICNLQLSADRIEKFRKLKLAIAVCVGNAASNTLVATAARDLGMTGFQGVKIANSDTGTAPAMSPALESFLRRVGTDLLADMHSSKAPGVNFRSEADRHLCEENAMGYGNARKLLATYLNVPTSTITCLWRPGMFNGHPWMPLLIRRGYLSKLIVT